MRISTEPKAKQSKYKTRVQRCPWKNAKQREIFVFLNPRVSNKIEFVSLEIIRNNYISTRPCIKNRKKFSKRDTKDSLELRRIAKVKPDTWKTLVLRKDRHGIRNGRCVECVKLLESERRRFKKLGAR